jgi:hypothetical protein
MKQVADLSAKTVSPEQVAYISDCLGYWDNVDFDDKRTVADSLISTIRATCDRINVCWKN